MDAAEVLAQLRADPGLRDMARALLLGDEVLRLPELVVRLAEGQAKLFEGQAKLEAAVERLTEGQAKLEAAVERLTEGQAKLEAAVERLTEGQSALWRAVEALRKEVGGLSNTIGGTAEEDAADVVEYVARQRGLRLLGLPTATDLDGDGELDLWVRVQDENGNELSILVEAKVRLRAREVRVWAAHLDDPAFLRALARRGIEGPHLPYAFGIRVYGEAREAARSLGVGVLSSRGEDVPPELIATA